MQPPHPPIVPAKRLANLKQNKPNIVANVFPDDEKLSCCQRDSREPIILIVQMPLCMHRWLKGKRGKSNFNLKKKISESVI